MRAVEADHAGLERFAEPQPALQVAGVDVGDEAVLRGVGERDRLLLGVEDDHRSDRPEDLLTQDRRVRRHIDQHGRPGRRSRVRPGPFPRRSRRAPSRTAPSTSDSTFSRPAALISGPELHAILETRAHPQRAHRLAELARRTRPRCRAAPGSGWRRCTPRHRCASSPPSRRRRQLSRSASSNTTNGALPPSSIEQFTMQSAACCSRPRPTSVEPVNESLRTRGSWSIAETTGA